MLSTVTEKVMGLKRDSNFSRLLNKKYFNKSCNVKNKITQKPPNQNENTHKKNAQKKNTTKKKQQQINRKNNNINTHKNKNTA